jgi:hypothetical protein
MSLEVRDGGSRGRGTAISVLPVQAVTSTTPRDVLCPRNLGSFASLRAHFGPKLYPCEWGDWVPGGTASIFAT